MNDQPTDGPALIAETVGRLRSVQEDFADETPELRHQHLREELDRALSRLVPARRPAFLEQVLRRFPHWDTSGNGTPTKNEAVGGNAESLMSDPESLAQRLIDAAADLPEDRRQSLRDRLAAAGLAASGSAWPADIATKLKLPANANIAPERVLEVLGRLLTSADQVDDVAWQTWRQLDRQGTRRKPGDFKRVVKDYLVNEGADSSSVAERISLFQRLAGSLIYELREIDVIARQQAERFSPEKIQEMSDEGFFTSIDAACWRTFKKVAEDYDASAIEREIKQRIAQHVEENLR